MRNREPEFAATLWGRFNTSSIPQKEPRMTPLRKRMIDDMKIRNFQPKTQKSYLYHVADFARYFKRSPEFLGPEHIRTFQLNLIEKRGVSIATLRQFVAVVRFFYTVTLKKKWVIEAVPIPRNQGGSPWFPLSNRLSHSSRRVPI